jgi:hypothetical protein
VVVLILVAAVDEDFSATSELLLKLWRERAET